MIHQLNPPLPVITPKGKALAHVVIDMGIEHDLQWICFQDATGECWTWSNPQIRAQINITLGRYYISPFYHPSEVAFKKDEEDENICDECGELNDDCCCESEDEDMEYWRSSYNKSQEEVEELKENMRDALYENSKIRGGWKELISLLLTLYNDDQVHPNQRGIVYEVLMKTEELEDGCHGRLISKSKIN